MPKTPRITVSLTIEEQNKLNKLVERLDLNSSAQLIRFLISGDNRKIDLVCEEAKNLYNLF